MKTYKIKKLEIPEQVQRYFQQIFNKTGATFLDKINELIDAHNESLSDKEEPNSQVSKHSQKDVYKQKTSVEIADELIQDIRPKQEESLQFKLDPLEKITRIELNPKQSTSLKEEITKMIFWNREAPINTAERILKLIQSHLVKEIEEKIDAKYDDGNEKIHPEKAYFECKQDIIKIINNI